MHDSFFLSHSFAFVQISVFQCREWNLLGNMAMLKQSSPDKVSTFGLSGHNWEGKNNQEKENKTQIFYFYVINSCYFHLTLSICCAVAQRNVFGKVRKSVAYTFFYTTMANVLFPKRVLGVFLDCERSPLHFYRAVYIFVCVWLYLVAPEQNKSSA